MIKKLTQLLFIAVFLVCTNGFAQQNYIVNLVAGEVFPQQNVDEIAKNKAVLTTSLFNNNYYVVIQFNNLPSFEQRKSLEKEGITLIDYLPSLAYTAVMQESASAELLKKYNVRSVFTLQANQKADAALQKLAIPAHANFGNQTEVSILLYQNLAKVAVESQLNALGAAITLDAPAFRMMNVKLPKANLPQLLDLPFVQWVEFIPAPNVPENLPGRSLHRVNIISDGVRNLKGDGMNIGVWDEVASQHLDFSPAGRMTNVETGTAGSHGTHVSGTVGGKGIINPAARGMAPNANIYSYNGFNNDVQVEMNTAIPAFTLISSNHSYHDGLGVQCGTTGASAGYSLRARNTDINLNNFNYHLHCHSAGNAQGSCASGWGTITGTGKSAKNNVLVAAISSTEGIASFSSFGPMHDGRVKPEISAMGVSVFSTYTPLNSYGTISGTSMSTPGVTGTLALLAQRYKQLNANALPASMLIKNIACNTAVDLGNVGPDYRFGFGRIDALAAVKILEENRYALNNATTGSTTDVTITVPAGAVKLNVMLTWNDPAAATNSAIALVNSLDLEVINGATTTLPWVLDKFNPSAPATKAVDNVSNIEQVTINNPTAGTYTLRVKGIAITQGANQPYSLTWNVDVPKIEVTYPNGSESFSPNATEIITWDNAGVTGNQTVEYSVDGGNTWTMISNVVAANVTRLNWTVPAGLNTSTARIRVSSGSLTDASDANFNILGAAAAPSVTVGTGCAAGESNVSWAAVTNANAYDLYRLNASTGAFVLVQANITATTFAAGGLVAGSTNWFMVVAKNTTTGAVAMRSLAASGPSSNVGGSIGAVGSITGNNNVCGVASAVTYSISPVTGATSYTWSVPAGATIVSGQGTTSISVNFGAGASSGNVSVFASNGSCQSATTNFPVSIGSSVPAATSAGDQTANVCIGAPIPTLTANAFAAPGLNLIWFTSATGTTTTLTPTLNGIGTITYYAASINNATGCVSNTRTAVTLTISQAAATTASASTATTFCQGGSVTLAASANTSYLWSNGATTQSITVSTAGNYTVTGTTAGCSSTSSAIPVVVNALPTPNVVAAGPTSFCAGSNVVLNATGGSSYLWSNGATGSSITVSAAGNYSATATSAAGCTASSNAIAVTVANNPTVSIAANPYTSLYPSLFTNLTANVSPAGSYVYEWFNNGAIVPNATTNTITNIGIEKIGSYTVKVTNATGLPCSKTSNAFLVADSAISRLFIWPSPNNGQFKVSFYTPGAVKKNSLVIYDSKGSRVFVRQYSLNTSYEVMNVDLRGKTGWYRVVVLNEQGKKQASGSVVVR
jgi:Subtilase family/PKD-like domain/Ig-like domain CHU_C associated